MSQDFKSSSENLLPPPQELHLNESLRTNQIAQDVWDDCLSRFMGINRNDARCMDIIDRHGRVTAGALAAESRLTTGAVTIVVDRLVAAGYALRTRDSADRRKVWISITPAGNEISGMVFAHFKPLMPVILEHFTPDQLAAILRFLEVGARINLEQAAILEQFISGKAKPLPELTDAARRFEQAAASHMQTIIESLTQGGADES